ncbi:MAG: exodeoxyribonuclease VII large subunit [Micropruina sp.]
MPMTSSPEQPQPLRVVVAATKNWVERLGPVWVEGQLIEISRRAGASTHFLTLRDKVAEVSVKLSASPAVLDAAGPITEGTVVAALVRPTLWSRSGSLTFECRDLRPSGEGRLLAQLEQRKRMLQAEGLFNHALKKRLPFLPRRIGLITGKASAAERDVVENIARRWAAARLEIRHALMQGTGAVEQIVSALQVLDRTEDVDVIIIARGGGSLEDLLPFSDETLVRAVHACRTPIVSAIGHESDTPIIDLVADLRASTPTDAAKRVVPDAGDELHRVQQSLTRVRQAVAQRVTNEERRLRDLRSRPVLREPTATLDLHAERLEATSARLRRGIENRLREERQHLGQTIGRVRVLSPAATLERGYAILTDAHGETVARTVRTEPGAALTARLSDGSLTLSVTAIHTQPEEA